MSTIYDSPVWREDVRRAVKAVPDLDMLAGKNLMITGAAGLICSAIVDILFAYNDTHEKKIQILAAGRWIEEMTQRFGDRTEREDFHFVVYDAARTDNNLDIDADYIIHAASNAFPDMVMKEPVETMLSNMMGIYYMLKLAKEHHTKRVLYVSSSEVYGKKEGTAPYREGEYGYIDQLNPRNSYSVGKRAAETMCASFADEYGVESVIVRPGHIYGPTASPFDTRVSSAFAWSAARGEQLVMKSEGNQLRSYCHCLDCATAMLWVLLKGQNKTAYNISNPDSIITIFEMAQILAKAGGTELRRELPSAAEIAKFNPMSNSSLESRALEGLGWKGLFSAEEGLTHTVETLKTILE